MKKGLLLGAVALTLLSACNGGSEVTDQSVDRENSTKIFGNIRGISDGEQIKLWVFEDGKEQAVDSCNASGGNFELYTATKELREYVIDFGEKHQMVYLFLDESAGDVDVSGTYANIGSEYTVSGDQNSVDYHDYWMFLQPLLVEEESLYKRLNLINPTDQEGVDDLQLAIDSVDNLQREYAVNYINEKPESPVSWIMLQEFYPPGGIADFDSTDLAYFDKVANAMEEKYPYSEYPSYVRESLANTQAQMTQLKEGVNDAAPDLAFSNPEGKVMKLSDLRGQVVLLDFWASWCGPCRKENPNVVKTYEKYKDQGFTVFSVSLDQDINAWKAAIEADNLSWPNHVSDLKGWQSEAAAVYKVNSIPATFLLDKDGNIIAKNLRGAMLEQKLLEVL